MATSTEHEFYQQAPRLVGASPRTLGCLFLKKTGMQFGCWRDQFRALTALPRLMDGAQITTVTDKFGYATPGAFAAMFKRAMGAAPSHFVKTEGLK